LPEICDMTYEHHLRRKPVPDLLPLGADETTLVKIAAERIRLPHPGTVNLFRGAIFPTIRNPRRREQPVEKEGRTIGMHDDNTTPRWALLWAHGIPGKSKRPTKGWTIAHVWDRSGDMEAYTHLANLALLPEYLGSLSDKQGPLTHYLRYHAWRVYGWKPSDADSPMCPDGYDSVCWNYFDPVDDPAGFIRDEFAKAGCNRSEVLKPLMPKALGGML
jgi:hypothetical protein